MGKRKSVIWKLSKQEFNSIVQESSSYKEVLIKMGFAIKSGGNYKTLKQRILEDGINVCHIKENMKLFRGTRKKIPIEDILVEHSTYTSVPLKKRLLKEGYLENKCSKCDIESEWQGEPITLQLDHINGNHNDNRLGNLRILCPNCHSQTETFSGKNAKRIISENRLCKCGKEKDRQANVCLKCYTKPEKIKWPSNKELRTKLKNQSYLSLSRELGVSDNAIRKRLKSGR